MLFRSSAADVERADFVLVGHSHFDHLWGAETIAANTGATVIGSHETVRVLREAEVPSGQLVAIGGLPALPSLIPVPDL